MLQLSIYTVPGMCNLPFRLDTHKYVLHMGRDRVILSQRNKFTKTGGWMHRIGHVEDDCERVIFFMSLDCCFFCCASFKEATGTYGKLEFRVTRNKDEKQVFRGLVRIADR